MATKRVCDRCGAEINPCNSVTYAGMRRVKVNANAEEYELCVSCAYKLRKWFNGGGERQWLNASNAKLRLTQ